MSAYTTREVSREEAIEAVLKYQEVERRRNLLNYDTVTLETVLNRYAYEQPELYLLTNWIVKETPHDQD